MKNINNLIIIDLLLDKPKQPCALRSVHSVITECYIVSLICVLYVLIAIYSFYTVFVQTFKMTAHSEP